MAIQVTTKLKLHLKIKRKLLSHVHLVLLHIEGCLLDYVMHQLYFKDACLVYSMIWLNIFWRFLWMIFSVFGDSFDDCLTNLEKVLNRCEEKNLILNWEKCHCDWSTVKPIALRFLFI